MAERGAKVHGAHKRKYRHAVRGKAAPDGGLVVRRTRREANAGQQRVTPRCLFARRRVLRREKNKALQVRRVEGVRTGGWTSTGRGFRVFLRMQRGC